MKARKLSLQRLCEALGKDERITAWHLGICVTLFMLWTDQGQKKEISASRSKLMYFSRIKSIVTYHKCIGELNLSALLPINPPTTRSGAVNFFF
jgi:hypothetical protein